MGELFRLAIMTLYEFIFIVCILTVILIKLVFKSLLKGGHVMIHPLISILFFIVYLSVLALLGIVVHFQLLWLLPA